MMLTGFGETLYPALNTTDVNPRSDASELATVKSTLVVAGVIFTTDPSVIVFAEIVIPVSPFNVINLLISEVIVSIS